MAESSFEIEFSAINHRRRPRHTTPVPSHQSPAFSFSSSHTSPYPAASRRTRVPPTTPFASDNDRSWQAEISWQFEPTSFQDNRGSNLGAALTPWAEPTPRVPPTPGSRVFRRSANDYFLSRTSTYEQSSYSRLPSGRIELQSYVAKANPIPNKDHHPQRSPTKSATFASTDRKKGGHLATDSELCVTDDDLEVNETKRKHDQNHAYGHGGDARKPSSPHQISYMEEGDLDEDDEAAPPKAVGVLGLFKYSTKFDIFLVIIGSLGALINGGSLPWYSFLFGKFVNKIASDDDNDKMMKDVKRICVLMVALSGLVVIGAYLRKYRTSFQNEILRTFKYPDTTVNRTFSS